MNFNYLKYSTAQILVFLLLFSLKGFSQKIPSWKTGEDIYQDSDLRLKIYMKIDSNSCSQNSNVFSEYKFKILAKSPNPQSQYITFSFDFVDCNYEIFTQTISVDISSKNEGEEIESRDFTFNNIRRLLSKDRNQKSFFYNVKRSDTDIQESKSKYAKPPKSISGNNQIILGESTKLTVIGDALSDGVKWMWYKDSCNGTKLGIGLTLDNIKPTESTTYFVCAQDVKLDYKTTCASITINVDAKSKEADKIFGETLICDGKTSLLTVKGGKLGKGAKWVWYEGNVNSKSVGEGEKLVVSPKKKTTYFARAEGSDNITNAVSYEVDIASNSIFASGIKGPTEACTNENIDLIIIGGQLGSNSQWVWYNENDMIVGRGEVLNTSITIGTQLFKVRAEGMCNNTDFASTTIQGISSSSIYRINSNGIETKKTKLNVEGSLGNKAEWVWYVNSKKKPSEFSLKGKGPEIIVPNNKFRTYKVIAEQGTCDARSNTSEFITIGSKAEQKLKRKIDYVYYRLNQNVYRHKLFHLGASIGAFNQMNNMYLIDNSVKSNSNIAIDSTNSINLVSNGISWDVSCHPIIYEKHKNQTKNPFSASVGFFYKGGMANFNLNSFNSNINDTIGKFNNVKFNNISYMSVGTELAIGLRGFRFYYSYEIENSNLNLKTDFVKFGTTKSESISFNQNLNLEKNKLGLRFGRYASRNSLGLFRGVVYDLYFMSINSQYNDVILSNHYPAIGAGFSLWTQSLFKLQAEFTSFANRDTYTTAKLIFNLDLFY
jgi:hypothetical protein